ncbi:MAG: cyclic lactone autoinducer peptide [Bacillota bacterium]
MKEKKSIILKAVIKTAKFIGDGSVDGVCQWWLCQPKVPDAMMNKEKKKN